MIARPSECWLRCVACVVVAVLAVNGGMTGRARAEFRIDLEIKAENVAGVTTYRAYAYPGTFPNDPFSPFVSGNITSQDNQYGVHTQDSNAWVFDSSPAFQNFDDLLASLNQPWKVFIDAGLPTERNYTMALQLGSLSAADVVPPRILSPAHLSDVSTPTPHFTLALPPGIAFTAQVRDPFNNVLTTFVPPGTTDWSPFVPLTVGKTYVLDLYAGGQLPGANFLTPLDANEDPLADFASSARTNLEGISVFYAVVPEPSTLLLAALAGMGLVWGWWRSRRPTG